MTLGSLFDGIGGFPLAASRVGIKPVWASEIEPAPISITKRHFPGMAHLGDITKISGAGIEPVDIITFGSPCQDLSVAGKQKGLAGGRSGLFHEAARVMKEMRGATGGRKPDFAVWENVPGAFSSSGGEDFRAVLREIASTAEQGVSIPRPKKWGPAGAVLGGGWSLAWRVLDAQYWGVPQRRKRIFLVADFGGGCAGEILFERGRLPGHTAEGGAAGEGTPGSAGRGFGAAGFLGKQGVKAKGIGFEEGKSPTLVKGVIAGKSHALNTVDRHAVCAAFSLQSFGEYRQADKGSCLKDSDYKRVNDLVSSAGAVRRLTPTEFERLQGFPDGWTAYGHGGKEISDSQRYRALGNSVAVPCVEFVLSRIANLGRGE